MTIHPFSVYCAVLALVLLCSGCAEKRDLPLPAPTVQAVTEAVTVPAEAAQSPENEAVRALAEEFAACYFAQDQEGMREYLTEDHGSLLEVSPYDRDQIFFPDDNACSLPQSALYALVTTGSCPVSVRFYESRESDSYTYLSLTLVKEKEQWKIQSYGLEK